MEWYGRKLNAGLHYTGDVYGYKPPERLWVRKRKGVMISNGVQGIYPEIKVQWGWERVRDDKAGELDKDVGRNLYERL